MLVSESLTRSRSRAVALVLVLTMLVLLSGLIVAFLATVSTERIATQAGSSNSLARQIADSTVNLAIGQIREATTQPREDTTWASQPGAIRTFSGGLRNSKAPSRKNLPNGAYYNEYVPGANDWVYKLYSADRMKVQNYSGELRDEVNIIETWDRIEPKPGYVDLNEPMLNARRDIDPSGLSMEPRYPIIDPRAKLDRNEKPTGSEPGIVEGFDAKLSLDSQLRLVGNGNPVAYLPMPVRWLYVLRDGSIGPASRATAENPIVGRTAFWTDDETCKLNINTASEGTFWDTPSVSSEQESGQIPGTASSSAITSTATSLSLGASQPVRGEFQRYPGHPATTSLSPVLGWLWDLPPSMKPYPQAKGTGAATYRDFKEAIYQISPFTPYGTGTSQGATRNSEVDASFDGALNVSTKRLYTTVDELIFKSQRVGTGANPKGVVNNDKLSPEALEKVRFFLSATSRSPEINLFGRPRMTIWPINANFDLRTRFDDLFLFTSTISRDRNGIENNDKRYCLYRANAKDDVADYNAGHNTKMFSYLQYLTGSEGFQSAGKPGPEIPGFGGRFSQKYGFYDGPRQVSERDQILTEIVDYMRTVNLVDTGTASRTGNVFVPYTPRFYRPNYLEGYGRGARSIDWAGQVTPLRIRTSGTATSGPMGMGRFITVTEAAIVFHRSGALVAGKEQPNLKAVMLFEMTTPMPGFPGLRETYYTVLKTKRASKISIPGTSVSERDIRLGDQGAGLINICNVPAHEVTFGRGFMPGLGFTAALHCFAEHKKPTDPTNPAWAANPELDPARRNDASKIVVKRFDNSQAASRTYFRATNDLLDTAITPRGFKENATAYIYPYVSDSIPLALPNGTLPAQFEFKGGEYELEIWSGEAPDDNRSRLVQTIQLNFPESNAGQPAKLPIPKNNAGSDSDFRTRFDASLDGKWNCLNINGTDVVRSLELTCGATGSARGDLRLAMTRALVPREFFEPRGGVSGWFGSSAALHGLTSAHGDPVAGFGGAGTLGAGTNNRGSKPPVVPSGINGVTRADGGPGDWDRGLSKHTDGAFGNKVDEGNVRFRWDDASAAGKIPYFRGRAIEETGQTFFTPNRQLSSPVMFGSLPSGSVERKPWQTLLFRPDRDIASKPHPGAAVNGPPDHLLLDLFHLPVVEPYAISEPFSTAGKVNLNHVIAPFGYAKGEPGSAPGGTNPRSYLRRDTALRGVLKSTFVMAVPNGASNAGHEEDPLGTSGRGLITRYPIALDRTLSAIETRLKDGTGGDGPLFRSASEICEFDLYPDGLSVSDWTNFWTQNAATGDNMRERPYAHIYPRLTTRSNVYTVHLRCQAVSKAPGSDPKVFDPIRDKVLSEYRGSATIERFIDPNDRQLENYDDRKEKVDPYYRYRIIGTKQFLPK